jgi:outer membrane protein assembly factor BamB
MLGGDPGRTGVMPGGGPATAPVVAWEHYFDEGLLSTPAIVDGVAYVGTGWIGDVLEDPSLFTRPGSLEAIDIESGNSIWSVELPMSSESSPAVADGMVFIADNSGAIHGVTAADGQRVWSTATDRPLVGAPIVSDGIVYVASGDAYELNVALADQTVLLAAGLINDDGVEYISNAVIYALEAATGKVLWHASDFPQDKGAVVAFDAGTGTERWRHTVDAISLNASTDGAAVYFGIGNSGVLKALDLASGQERWQFDTGKIFWAGVTPSVSAGQVFVTTDHGSVFAIDAASGKEIWNVDLFELWMFSQPLVAGDHLYVADRSGLIYALRIADGTTVWSYELRPTTSFSGRLVVIDNTLYTAQTAGAEDDPYKRVGYLSALSSPD